MPDQLTAIGVKALPPGRHSDGRGLYAIVGTTGSKSWVFRYKIDGKSHDMGLGSISDVTLKEARLERDRLRMLRRQGVDPINHRRQERAARRLVDAKAITFRQAAERFIETNKSGWSNPKHAAQWAATLDTYAHPVIGALPVGDVTTEHLVQILAPIWATKNETASRVRGRIESTLDFATVQKWRAGDNPARWRGHLQQVLPKRSKVQAVEHHAALPFNELPAFVAGLKRQEGMGARALEFTILTACRTGESLGATWREIDLGAKLWTIPAGRMKGRREHRVPLSGEAIAMMEALRPDAAKPEAPIFPGARHGKPLSNMAMLVLLRRMKRGDLTAHGFRSTFRDWAAESTAFHGEVVEMALAHVVGSKVEAAYRRGDLLDKRRELMQAWAGFASGGSR